MANALAGLKPVRAGRFLVHGAHDRAQVGIADVGIEIEAGLAFGTGHHGTTRGCLMHFDRLLKRRRPRKVLDVGCGAGVLAIAAAKILRRKVWLGDIDPVAVEVANANARLNGVAQHCHAIVSRGVESLALREGAPYDVVFANILARPLRLLAPSLAAVTGPDGDAIVSGLLLADVPGVLSSWAAQGFFLAERIDLEGWASLRLRRGVGTTPFSRKGRRKTPASRRAMREKAHRASPACRRPVVRLAQSLDHTDAGTVGGAANGENSGRGRPQAAAGRRSVRRHRRSREAEASARPVPSGGGRLHSRLPDHRRLAGRHRRRGLSRPRPAGA